MSFGIGITLPDSIVLNAQKVFFGVQGSIFYLLNALGIATKGEQTTSLPTESLALDYEGTLVDYGGAVNSESIDVAAVPGSRLDTGVIYDTDTSGNDLHPYTTVNGVKNYTFHPAHKVSTAYSAGDKVFAVASDGIKHYYSASAGTTGATAPTFPTTGTVVDGTVTWTEQGLYTLSGQRVEGSATNKITCQQVNPTGFTNILKNGDALATLTIVDDTAALTAAGLIKLCTAGTVYKLDNSAGSLIARAAFSDVVGNTNEHTISAYAHGSGKVAFSFTGSGAIVSGTDYVRYTDTQTPADAANIMQIRCNAGEVAYFILPQLEESAYATSIMADNVAASVTRPAVNLTVLTEDTDLTPTEGAVRLIVTPTAGGQNANLLIQQNNINGTDYVRVDIADSSVRIRRRVSGAVVTTLASIISDPTKQFFVDAMYSPSTLKVDARNVGDGHAVRTIADPRIMSAMPDVLHILENAFNTEQYNGTVDSLRIFANSEDAANQLDDWSL